MLKMLHKIRNFLYKKLKLNKFHFKEATTFFVLFHLLLLLVMKTKSYVNEYKLSVSIYAICRLEKKLFLLKKIFKIWSFYALQVCDTVIHNDK